MTELNMGRTSSSQNYDIDLSDPNLPDPNKSDTLEDLDLSDPAGDDKTKTEPTGDDLTGDDKTDPTGVDPTGDDKTKTDPTGVDPVGDDKIKEELQVSDEVVLKYLSEKQGKDFKTLDDLFAKDAVDNPLDSDPYLKNLYEWRKETGRPIEDWYKFQKDWKSVSDLEVAREMLQLEYPTLDEDDINLEMKKFISDEVYDEDDVVASKRLELKKYATKGRDALSKMTKELGDPTEMRFTPEIQEDLLLAKTIKEKYNDTKKAEDEYVQKISQTSVKTEGLKLQLADDLNIDFKLPEESKKILPDMIATMPSWKNEDGSWNHQSVVNDAIKIKHFDDIVKLAYEQGVNAGKEDLLKTTKNVNTQEPVPMGSTGTKGVEIEGFDDYVGNKGVKVRFGRK